MSFDALAPHYRWMEMVLAGPLLQRCRTRYLDALRDTRRLLVLGPGRGRFVRRVVDSMPAVRMTLVDSSREMLRRVADDLGAAGVDLTRIRFEHADIRSWAPAEPGFDAIASHFFLDCFAPDEVAAIVGRVSAWSVPGSVWLVSDFQVPPQGWRRRRAQAVHALMYAVFRPLTGLSAMAVSPPDPFLARAGFRLEAREVLNHGLLHTDVWRRIA